MDVVIFQKAKSVKNEVTTLCENLRAAYELFTSKQAEAKAYADGTLEKAQAKNVQDSIIKSVQRGTVTEAGAVTISAVDTSKCLLLVDGGVACKGTTTSFISLHIPNISFNSSTEINITSVSNYANWQVIEFY